MGREVGREVGRETEDGDGGGRWGGRRVMQGQCFKAASFCTIERLHVQPVGKVDREGGRPVGTVDRGVGREMGRETKKGKACSYACALTPSTPNYLAP